MGYRPDIENPFSFMTGEIIPKYEKQHKAFEMGITATIEALKKEATKHFNSLGHLKEGTKGYIVFIPEEA